MQIEPIVFENERLSIIDQTQLPGKLTYVILDDLQDVVEAIRSLKIRGAPAIGVVAGYGLYVEARHIEGSMQEKEKRIRAAGEELKRARPTAVNLSWAVDRLLNVLDASENNLLESLKLEAQEIHQYEKAACEQIGAWGMDLIKGKKNILTHCNAGILATGGIGTALAPIYKVHQARQPVHVYVDETRPVGQGARLTYWELNHHKVPCTLIADNMAAMLMAKGEIDAVIVGADRIAANGDAANKIGTYSLAVTANHHGIPFYVAAPLSTFDLTLKDGSQIPIEQRNSEEITAYWKIPREYRVKTFNPAFDVTPAELITAIVTQKGIIEKPNQKNIFNQIN